MAKIRHDYPVGLASGKVQQFSDGSYSVYRVVHDRQQFYIVDPNKKKKVVSEAMRQTRNAFAEAHAEARAIEKDPERAAHWSALYKKACEHHRRHPKAYEQFRREELESQGKRVRPQSLNFPVDLHRYIVSSLMRQSTPWT